MTCPQRTDLAPDAWIDLWPGLMAADAERWLSTLAAEIPWTEEHHRMFGRDIVAPRRVSWHGDPEARYRYSGIDHVPQPWTDTLRQLRGEVESVTGLRFNAVLANLYRDGADGMGWHRDAEPEIGPSPADRWIASLSFGAPRRFVLRHRRTRHKTELSLGRGDLLVMRGTTQDVFQHAAPKTKRPVLARINLTFRHIVPAGNDAVVG